jgi:hypothetical protein
MSVADSNVGGITVSAQSRLSEGRQAQTRSAIRWGRVIAPPAILALSMALFGLALASHTRSIEMRSDRHIAETDQSIARMIEERPIPETDASVR